MMNFLPNEIIDFILSFIDIFQLISLSKIKNKTLYNRVSYCLLKIDWKNEYKTFFDKYNLIMDAPLWYFSNNEIKHNLYRLLLIENVLLRKNVSFLFKPLWSQRDYNCIKKIFRGIISNVNFQYSSSSTQFKSCKHSMCIRMYYKTNNITIGEFCVKENRVICVNMFLNKDEYY